MCSLFSIISMTMAVKQRKISISLWTLSYFLHSAGGFQLELLLGKRDNHYKCHNYQNAPFQVTALYNAMKEKQSEIVSGEHDDTFSACLIPKQQLDQFKKEDYAVYDQSPFWIRSLLRPLRSLKQRRWFPSKTAKPGCLILIKTGQTTWQRNFTFTGWADPDLTSQGEQEMEHAARLLLEAGYEPDIIYTSRLKRAIHSAWILAKELDSAFLPIFQSWRLNERMYGSLQGLSKRETAKRVGTNVVQAWRRSLKARPPAAKPGDMGYPKGDRRYADIPQHMIPVTESLQDCMDRAMPLWKLKISKELRKGNNVLVVGHSNSLRGLAKIIDDIGDKEIEKIRFPSGIPYVYKFDPKTMKPLKPSDDDSSGTVTQPYTSGEFLEKPGLLKEALKRQDEWRQSVPGIEHSSSNEIIPKSTASTRMTTLERSLLKLKEEQEIERWAAQFSESHKDGSDGQTSRGAEKELIWDGFEEDLNLKNGATSPVQPNVGQVNAKTDPVVVLVRHGTTPHNQLALFTGWEDPSLTEVGVEDAKHGGRLLKKHGFEFDVVYTSWLTRAIQTAWYILDELDTQWVPTIKSWRLNERHYGALTGKSKKMVGNIYGQDQLKKWRRGFDIRPPKTSAYSFSYPGNDSRRTRYVKDIRISFTETFCRSIEARELQIHRKFPKSESLKDCMGRTIPFYTERIVPEAVSKGKRVLIASHENAIRGILMHLCEIPPEHMNELHLPNGVPLVYNVRRKCISLLDDGSGIDPMEKYSFGSAAQFLFRPCELVEEDFIVDGDVISSQTSGEGRSESAADQKDLVTA